MSTSKFIIKLLYEKIVRMMVQGAFELPATSVPASDLNARQILYEYWARLVKSVLSIAINLKMEWTHKRNRY